MKLSTLVCAFALLFAADAIAQEKAKAAAPMMDMSKMGPWTRKPKNEKKIKKEVADLIKTMDSLAKKKDFDAALTHMDFPVFMITDGLDGKPAAEAWDKARYVKEMKPFWEHGPEMKMKHRTTVTVLSDALVSVVDNFTMTMGKKKLSGKNTVFLVRKDGKLKFKMMAEAGWAPPPGTKTAQK